MAAVSSVLATVKGARARRREENRFNSLLFHLVLHARQRAYLECNPPPPWAIKGGDGTT